jgi:hypothetical protein
MYTRISRPAIQKTAAAILISLFIRNPTHPGFMGLKHLWRWNKIPGAICKTLDLNYRNYMMQFFFHANFYLKKSKSQGKNSKSTVQDSHNRPMHVT